MPILKDNPTKQEIFDMAAIAVINQGKPSRDGSFCRYLSDDGSKCAVGHLLTEKQIKDINEEGCVNYISSAIRNKIPSWVPSNLELLADIQRAHDNADDDGFVEKFKSAMELVGFNHNLSTSALEVKPVLQAPIFDVMSWMSDILQSTEIKICENNEETQILRLEHIVSD